ncbi:MAG: glycosyltransferase family 4 protein [Gammaproteobacteria bacterium]|nr:glycosyltransferase family 4 protein [Gammaproteobacteria bacterium]
MGFASAIIGRHAARPESSGPASGERGAAPIAVHLGRLLARLVPGRWQTRHIFFFGAEGVGGAERVHQDILDCVANAAPLVVLSDSTADRSVHRVYRAHAKLVSVAGYERHPIARDILIGFLAGRIDALAGDRARAVVFGAKSRLFYDLLPHLAGAVKVDLIHAFGGRVAMEQISLPVATRLDRRVVVTRRSKREFETLYRVNGIAPGYVERVQVVTNRVTVPAEPPVKSRLGALEVLYVGRGSPEKRVHLLLNVARRARAKDMPCRFDIVGNVAQSVPPALRGSYRLCGWIDDPERIRAHYRRAHVLLLTSNREGFPLAIMEAMAHGVVPITTDVGGIAEHLVDGRTGFLIDGDDEGSLVEAMAARLALLAADRHRLGRMALAAHAYARRNFSGEHFGRAYREILRA